MKNCRCMENSRKASQNPVNMNKINVIKISESEGLTQRLDTFNTQLIYL